MTIEICKKCEGTGMIRYNEGYHNSDWEEETCTNCKGSGKVRIGSCFYEVPFDTNINLIYKYSTVLVETSRELEKIARTEYENKD